MAMSQEIAATVGVKTADVVNAILPTWRQRRMCKYGPRVLVIYSVCWAAVVPRALGGRPRRSGQLASGLQERRFHKGSNAELHFDGMCDQLNVCDKFAAMLKNEVRTCDLLVSFRAIMSITHFHDDDLNLAVLAACRLSFPRLVPVNDAGNEIGEKESRLRASEN